MLIISGIRGFAQQDPMFTQYMNNPVLINPAYAGSQGELNFNGIFRKQWVGLEWQPTTTTFSINSPMKNNNVGVGATFINDKIGPIQQTGVYLDYAYYLEFDNRSKLSMGLMGGFNYYQKDLRGLTTYEDDPLVNQYPVTAKPLFNAGVGLYYYSDRYFIGASVPKLLRNSLTDADNTYELIGREERHYFFTGGMVFKVNTILKFKPTAMVRMISGAPASLEVSGTAIFYDQFWVGLTYRVQDAIAAHARVQVNSRFQVGYSYDLNNSRLRNYNWGTHEIFLSYTFTRRGQRILSPRYF